VVNWIFWVSIARVLLDLGLGPFVTVAEIGD
jgi:hypothetical protein